MKYFVLALTAILSLYAEEEEISRGEHRTEGHHPGGVDHRNTNLHHDVNRDLRNLNNAGGAGTAVPVPVTPGVPTTDPNDDMNQIYQQNQK